MLLVFGLVDCGDISKVLYQMEYELTFMWTGVYIYQIPHFYTDHNNKNPLQFYVF